MTRCVCASRPRVWRSRVRAAPQRRFIEAALRYYHLSQLAKREIGALRLRCDTCNKHRSRLTPVVCSPGGRAVAEEELITALNAAVRRRALRHHAATLD
jgi:hypothetical protein